jgi:hypothetical protein
MLKRIKTLLSTEEGAVTVDWVVLTAAVVGLAGTVVYAIEGGTGSVATGLGSVISGITPDAGD